MYRPLPLWPWLWPLGLPAVSATAVQFAPLLPGGPGVWREELPRFVVVQSILLLVSLPVFLSPALLALLLLRSLAARDGIVQPRLIAFWGLCLGLAVTLGLYGFGTRLGGGVPLEVFLGVGVLLPVLGYGVGGWLGRRGEAAR